MAPRTATQQLAELLLGQPLDDWLTERRTGWGKRPYRRIAEELAHVTNGKVDVTGETLRLWHLS